MAQSLEQMLDARECEVSKAIHELREKLAPLEAELEKIAVAREAIGSSGIEVAPAQIEDDDPYKRMTYEELATKALASDHFEFGATIGELLDFISKQYGRDIAQGSFSPILSRMHKRGLLSKAGKAWFWKPVEADDQDDEDYDL